MGGGIGWGGILPIFDPWVSPTSLKELYPKMFACVVDKEARIFDTVVIAPDGGDRSWNLLFRREFQDWEMARFYAYFISHPKYL